MSGGCPSQFTASALTEIISSGALDARITMLKHIYSQRAEEYTAAMEKCWVPYGVKFKPCKGGYFFWVELPSGLTAGEVGKEAMQDGVYVMEGTSCMVPEDESVAYDRFIRICVALEDVDEAVEGIKRIGKVFERLTIKG
jgi:DNA-binding transcriptional MocR family regulator